MHSCRFALLSSLALVGHAAASTLHVPGDYMTIQAAIDAATPGDTVLVAAGTYFENVVLRSDLVLLSASGPAFTVIDGQSAASVVSATSVTDVTVSGFTLQHGQGSAEGFRHGGGFAAVSCGPTLVIQGNVFLENVGWDGGGLYIHHGEGPTILDNVFESNEAQAQSPSSYGVGGGVMMDGAATLRPTIRGNTFRYNHSDRGGSAIECFNYAEPVIEGNIFIGNTCSNTSPPYAAVITLGGGHGTVTSNTIVQNSGGFGIYGANESLLSIAQTIIAFNDVVAAVGCDPAASTTITCSDFFSNAGGDWTGCAAPLAGVLGNTSADPTFCNADVGDFTLYGTSPCAPAHSEGCGLVGALPVSCGPVAVAPTSWGHLKSGFR